MTTRPKTYFRGQTKRRSALVPVQRQWGAESQDRWALRVPTKEIRSGTAFSGSATLWRASAAVSSSRSRRTATCFISATTATARRTPQERWAFFHNAANQIGNGFQNVAHLFGGSTDHDGRGHIFFAVKENGDLLYFRYDGDGTQDPTGTLGFFPQRSKSDRQGFLARIVLDGEELGDGYGKKRAIHVANRCPDDLHRADQPNATAVVTNAIPPRPHANTPHRDQAGDCPHGVSAGGR